jgi:SPP1 family predicted phage head-tail adaptor
MIVGESKGGGMADRRHRVLIQQATTALDAAGQPIVTWSTRYASEPAKFEQVSGGSRLRGRQVEADVEAVFTVNYRNGYELTDRVSFQGMYYGIRRIHIPDGVKRFAELHCKAAAT